MPLVFTYGTLEILEVMEAVTGQVFDSREATAMGFVRNLIQDCVYPGMTPAKGETTSGRLYDGVDSKTLHILDEFEDEVYSRQPITVQTQEGERFEAFSYIIPLEHRGILTSQSWCRDYFIAHYLPEYVRSCRAFYQDITSCLSNRFWFQIHNGTSVSSAEMRSVSQGAPLWRRGLGGGSNQFFL